MGRFFETKHEIILLKTYTSKHTRHIHRYLAPQKYSWYLVFVIQREIAFFYEFQHSLASVSINISIKIIFSFRKIFLVCLFSFHSIKSFFKSYKNVFNEAMLRYFSHHRAKKIYLWSIFMKKKMHKKCSRTCENSEGQYRSS